MTAVTQPSKNKMLDGAWKAHKAAQRAEKKAKPAPDVDLSDQQRRPKKPTPAVKKKARK